MSSWKWFSVSLAGSGHRDRGEACQDVHSCRVLPSARGGETLLAIASDGAGSARRGGEGAAIVVASLDRQVGAWLAEGRHVGDLDRGHVVRWIAGAQADLAAVAAGAGLTPRDYSATLLLALVDDTAAAFAQIGDGAIVAASGPGAWEVQHWPQHGKTSRHTNFVCDADAGTKLAFRRLAANRLDIAMTTDGLEQVVLDFDKQRADAGIGEELLAPLRAASGGGARDELAHWLASKLEWWAFGMGCGDDLTMIVASHA